MALVAGAGLLLLCGGALAWFTKGPPNPAPQDGRALPGGVLVAWTPAYRVSLFGIESLHPFDIGKVERIGPHLMNDGLMQFEDFAVPAPVPDEALAKVHDAAYLKSLHDVAVLGRALEVQVPDIFPAAVVEGRVLSPFRKAVGGTLLAGRGALEHGVGINLGGGFHHARPALGHGFCVYNDVAYTVAVLREEGLQGAVLVIDTDAHQGDGNHAFFADDPTVVTFSMHGAALFPHPRVPGDLDLELDAGIQDDAYLEQLDASLERLFAEHQPALVIHVAGSDVLYDDPLGDLKLTADGLIQRDQRVLDATRRRGVPLLHTLAGGYGPSSADAQARSVAGMLQSLR